MRELVSLRITDQERIKTRLQEQGQVILALDGVPPDVGHEVLWVVRDCLSEEILFARPLLSSTQGDITALLQEVKRRAASLSRSRSQASFPTVKRRFAVRWPLSSQMFPINSANFTISKMRSSPFMKPIGTRKRN
jgi:hypothetical protein